MTRVVSDALRSELERHQTRTVDRDAVKKLLDEIAAIPRQPDLRSDGEILGYDAHGKWS